MNATVAGFRQFRLIYANPAQEQSQSGYDNRAGNYDLLWSYYANSVFDTLEASWSAYKANNRLYRNTRAIYNPTKRLCDFYAASIYPGALSRDGESLPEGVSSAIPFSADTNRQLKKAIAQFWQWSNFQTWKTVHVRWGAALGDLLCELVDDVEGGKVYANYVWPGFVDDLKLDNRGNVKMYALRYYVLEFIGPAWNQRSQMYLYRKQVDQAGVTVWKNNEVVEQYEHPYGFCPAVWYKHGDVGGTHGQPQIAGSLNKINELNSKASQIHDHIGKAIAAPAILTTDKGQEEIGNLFASKKRGETEPQLPTEDDQQSIFLLKGPADLQVQPMIGNLNLADALQATDKLYSEIEADNPEITFWSKLREMSQVTGPAAARLSGDVIARVQEAAGLYDQQNLKLFQMAVAIAGQRLAERQLGWADPTDAQMKFSKFNLESYDRGKLDFEIMPRPLIQLTEQETAEVRQAKAATISAEKQAGFPFEYILKEFEGLSDLQIAEIMQAKADAMPVALQPQPQQGDMMQPGGMMNGGELQTSTNQPANSNSQNAPAPAPAQQARQASNGGNGAQQTQGA